MLQKLNRLLQKIFKAENKYNLLIKMKNIIARYVNYYIISVKLEGINFSKKLIIFYIIIFFIKLIEIKTLFLLKRKTKI